ncbi:dTMP kinase [Desulfonatronovibrio magnus]|uniref:dTMP kinase n=1 Tax=Desulfonatronovibrio magnus TaxID=698827 RepID=UPI0005EB2A4F|nr:dTMP kinase [Desulfonatronovibrio magnus]
MFISFEGIEGCGKSTQAQLLAGHLEENGISTILTKEPGGSRLGLELRDILLSMESTDLVPETELFLYLADRSQHVHTLIKPALSKEQAVICDRFADSMIVYQGYARGLDINLLIQLNQAAVQGVEPELTILLDLPADEGLKRALSRNIQKKMTKSEGRFEAESLEFHEKTRKGYLEWAGINQNRFHIIDARKGVSEIHENIVQQVKKVFFQKY